MSPYPVLTFNLHRLLSPRLRAHERTLYSFIEHRIEIGRTRAELHIAEENNGVAGSTIAGGTPEPACVVDQVLEREARDALQAVQEAGGAEVELKKFTVRELRDEFLTFLAAVSREMQRRESKNTEG